MVFVTVRNRSKNEASTGRQRSRNRFRIGHLSWFEPLKAEHQRGPAAAPAPAKARTRLDHRRFPCVKERDRAGRGRSTCARSTCPKSEGFPPVRLVKRSDRAGYRLALTSIGKRSRPRAGVRRPG